MESINKAQIRNEKASRNRLKRKFRKFLIDIHAQLWGKILAEEIFEFNDLWRAMQSIEGIIKSMKK
jgi:hypothetical protein